MAKPPADVDLLSSAFLDAALARPSDRPEPLIPRGALWFFLLVPPLLVAINRRIFEETAEAILLEVVGNYIVTIAIGSLLWLFYHRLLPQLFQRVTSAAPRVGLHAGAILTSVVGGLLVYAPIQPYVCAFEHDGTTLRGWLPAFNVAVIVSTGFVVAVLAYEKLRRQARDVEQREQQARHAALAAQLAALQARTNPHFLFNSLNAVAGLIQEDPVRAEQMVERMSDLFRYTIDGSRRRSAPLREEMAMVRDYLDIEGIRLGDRLRYEVEVADGLDEVPVPPLLLQPIVENAIRHGVSQRREGGSVEVTVTSADGNLLIRVADDGPGPGGSSHTGSGTSMRELRKRLRLSYEDRASLETQQGTDGGYEVLLRLPMESEP